ncbi:MAG: thioredoxin-like (seleno)protein SaoT [Faecousia sp.]
MKHPCVEFILACACCTSLSDFVKEIAPNYPEVETRVYVAGKDTEYLAKYGTVTSSMLVINESEVLPELSKAAILKTFRDLSASAKS